ncbi:MAG TPA: tyrosine-protein phosphatase [Verrucomicrobiae bacterium]|jgi:protein tyrosine/serine phosphatase
MHSKNKRRVLGCLMAWLFLSALALGAHVAHIFYTDNFHSVVPGQVFRSGQMSPVGLASCIRLHGIRSIVNLRGEHPECQWFRDELATARQWQVLHRSLRLSSRKPASNEQMLELVEMLRDSPKPLLIHCDGGADRASLAAAIFLHDIEGRPASMAEKEFSPWYGHLPVIWTEKKAMRLSFQQHVLSAERLRSVAIAQ